MINYNKPKFSILLVFLLAFFSNLYAQEKLDSLKKIISGNYHDTIKIEAFTDLFTETVYDDSLLGFSYGEQAINLAERQNRPLGKANIFIKFAGYYKKSGKPDAAKYFYKEAVAIYLELNNIELVYWSYTSLLNLYAYEFNEDSCKFYARLCVEDLKSLGGGLYLAKHYINFGNNLLDCGAYSEAVNYIYKGFNIEEIKQDSFAIARGYDYLSAIYGQLNKSMESHNFMQKACEIAEKIKHKNPDAFHKFYPTFLMNLGNSYYYLQDVGNIDSSIICYKDALEFLFALDEEDKLTIYFNLAASYSGKQNLQEAQRYVDLFNEVLKEYTTGYYSNLGKLLGATIALDAKQYTKVIDELKGYLPENSYIEDNAGYYEYLHKAYFHINQYKLAYVNFQKYNELKDSLRKEENYQQIYSKEAEFKFQAKEAELIAEQEKESLKMEAKIRVRRIVIISLSSVVLLLIIISRVVFKGYKQKKKDNQLLQEQKKQIEEKEKVTASLLQELNHRVKNNLQMVSSLLTMQEYKSNNPEAINAISNARKRIESISLLHLHLYQTTEKIDANIAEYIEHLAQFLVDSSGDAEKVKLSLDIANIDLKTEIAIHIGLIVNELVVNALKYGVDENSDENEIGISLRKEANKLSIIVEDTGNNSETKAIMEKQGGSSLFGLKLVDILALEYNGKVSTSFNGRGIANVEINLPQKF